LGVADSGDPEQDLSELLLEIGEVAQASRSGALFLIDEMHNLDSPALAAICIAFQAISRRGLPVALIGAGLPDLQVRLIAAKPYADRLFQYRELGRLPDAADRAALVGPAATLGVEYEEKAARQVVRESAGYPYFIQEYGLELWNHAERSPIGLADLETMREIVTDSLERSFFGPRFQLASDAEQRYLAAMAALDDPPYRSSAVATHPLRSQGHPERLSLPRVADPEGLVWSPRRGQVDFTVPRFAEFLRENHPLASFDEA
jgi:hypothetical protein